MLGNRLMLVHLIFKVYWLINEFLRYANFCDFVWHEIFISEHLICIFWTVSNIFDCSCFWLKGSDISTDDRSYLMLMINSMNVRASQVFFYPRLLPLVSTKILFLSPSDTLMTGLWRLILQLLSFKGKLSCHAYYSFLLPGDFWLKCKRMYTWMSPLSGLVYLRLTKGIN